MQHSFRVVRLDLNCALKLRDRESVITLAQLVVAVFAEVAGFDISAGAGNLLQPDRIVDRDGSKRHQASPERDQCPDGHSAAPGESLRSAWLYLISRCCGG